VIIAGAVWSLRRYLSERTNSEAARLAIASALIAAGTLVLSGGGLVQGIVGHDEAFSLTLATGISVIYGGFLVAEGRRTRVRSEAAQVAT